MWTNILPILLNAVYCVVLNLDIYTDRARMPDGGIREWKRSPLTRLNISGQSAFAYLQLILVAISVITSVLLLVGVKNNIVRYVQIISTIASTVVFIVIMILTGNSHVNYA